MEDLDGISYGCLEFPFGVPAKIVNSGIFIIEYYVAFMKKTLSNHLDFHQLQEDRIAVGSFLCLHHSE